MKSSLFLDWFGVIADNDVMTRRWRRVEAQLLRQKYGGSLSRWISVHDRAFQWYLNYWSKHGPRSRRNYQALWKLCEVERMRRTLEWAGVEPPNSERELFKLDRELTYEITRRIDPTYPFARQTLETLRQSGWRLFLVSGADSTYVKGALEATKLKSFFKDTYSPDTLDAFKGSLPYWKKILRLSKSDPESSVVVDDRPKFLRVPAKLGFQTILVGRDPTSSQQFTEVTSIRQLLSASLLPNLKNSECPIVV
ncbi:MAG TPA: HAD family hydrolase [Candidatus Bathyarchaeia archaeon]